MGMALIGIEDEGIWKDNKRFGGIQGPVLKRLEISSGSPRSGLGGSVVMNSLVHSDCSGEKC